MSDSEKEPQKYSLHRQHFPLTPILPPNRPTSTHTLTHTHAYTGTHTHTPSHTHAHAHTHALIHLRRETPDPLCQQRQNRGTCRETSNLNRISQDSVFCKTAKMSAQRGPPWPVPPCECAFSANTPLSVLSGGTHTALQSPLRSSAHSRGGAVMCPGAQAAGNVITGEEATDGPEICPGVTS